MGFDFRFRQIGDSSDVRNLVDFISSQDLRYPRYDEWIEKTKGELSSGQKKAVMAFSDGKLVGDLIYQGHKSLPGFLELKNLRVNPRLRVREFGRFMLRQIEFEGKEKYKAIICDVRSERGDVISFLNSCGYKPILQGPLYDINNPDILFMKPLKRLEDRHLLISARNYGEGHIL